MESHHHRFVFRPYGPDGNRGPVPELPACHVLNRIGTDHKRGSDSVSAINDFFFNSGAIFDLPTGKFLAQIGYEPVLAASSTWDTDTHDPKLVIPYDLFRTLDKEGSLPPGMVRVKGVQTGRGKLEDFFIDRYEVANRQFREFINKGGYRNKAYWKQRFVKDGQEVWAQAEKGNGSFRSQKTGLNPLFPSADATGSLTLSSAIS
jgi:hypothetical protein